MDELMWGRTPVGGPFELSDQDGRTRTDLDFHGKLLVLYFGNVGCRDSCPMDLHAIASAVDLLGTAGAAVQPVFVTVDPAHDTADVLAAYVRSFHARLIGLTGTPEAIRNVAALYKVYYAKVPAPGTEGYVIDHTSFTYLMGRDGRYLGFFPPGTPAARMADVIRQQLAQ